MFSSTDNILTQSRGLVNLNVCNFSHLTLLTPSINFRAFQSPRLLFLFSLTTIGGLVVVVMANCMCKSARCRD